MNSIRREAMFLPKRRPNTHKGDYGRLLIIGGSVGYTGAPTLCARAAVRSGAGLVYLGVPEDIYAITAVKNDEAMPFPLACADGRLSHAALDVVLERLAACDVCVIGPGLGRSDALTKLVQRVALESKIPVVADADALFALAQGVSVLDRAHAPVILTPHEGEFRRLSGACTGDRAAEASEFAAEHGCTVVRKGPETVCAFPDGDTVRMRVGNPGMAKGGSGDVLAGIIGAFVCQLPLKNAVRTAVWVHGAAGDRCAERFGEYAMTPSDLIEALPEVTRSLMQKEAVCGEDGLPH